MFSLFAGRDSLHNRTDRYWWGKVLYWLLITWMKNLFWLCKTNWASFMLSFQRLTFPCWFFNSSLVNFKYHLTRRRELVEWHSVIVAFNKGIYLLKVNNRNTRTRCEICSKLTIKTPEQCQWHRSNVFVVNLKHISHLILLFLLLTLNM